MQIRFDKMKFINTFLTSGFLSVSGYTLPASAQSIFCPSDIVRQQLSDPASPDPFVLDNGKCTNGNNGTGAFSGAALASQALSGLSQTATTETNRTASNAIADRRAQETQRSAAAAADQSRSRASEERAEAARDRRRAPANPPAPNRDAEARDEAVRARRAEARAKAARARQAEAKADAARKAETQEAAAMARRAEARAEAARQARAEARADAAEARRLSQRRRQNAQVKETRDQESRGRAYRGEEGAAPRAIVRKGYDPIPVLPAPLLVEAPRYGVFAQGFGDFEQRNGRASSSVQYTGTVYPLEILQKSTTRTVGFLGGLDMTVRNTFEPGDGMILGLLTGYTETSIDIQTRTAFAPSANLASGAASTKVSLSGPSVGVFATYFMGGFSIDQTFKADFYGLDQTFTETAAFAAVGATTVALITGSGRTGVTQLSAIGNANYRLYADDTVWFEPTVGYQYTHSSYEQSAAQLGLSDGYLIRLQGGGRLGFDTYLGSTRLSTSLTGLAYENIVINGGFIQAGAFGSNVVALNDQGKLRGQGILTFALDHGNGIASFIQGDVRGGDRYFAAGGRAGLRYQW